MKIPETTFVVTDVETTGTSADSNRIIEIGAVKIQGEEVTDRFQQLVNPQRSIPGRISRLTGISTGMVFDAPSIGEVLPDYLDFLGENVLVAHNLSFDQGFLNAELRRTGRDPLSNEALCTLRLARRLLPGLDSKGLSRLVQFYDIDVNGRHRALGDAEATGIVFRRFLRQLAFEHEIDTLEDLLAFQYRQYQKVRETPNHLQRIREEVLPDVPESPGVYALTNGSGAALYIGKASCLSDRLRSHFTAVESQDGRRRKMLQKVRDVDWEPTPTELQALLRESRLIKARKPRYNRAQRRYYSRPFLRLDTAHAYPAISWTRSVTDDGAEYYGPVRNVEQAEQIVNVVGRFFRLRECDDERLHLGQRCLYADMDRCVAPCETDDPEQYAEVVRRVRAFLEGRDRTVLDRLRERMQQASEQRDYEKAAEFRDLVEQLERVLDKQALWAAPLRRRNGVLVHPTDAKEGRVHLYFVRCGQFADLVTIQVPPTEEDCHRVRSQWSAHFAPETEAPPSFSKKDVNEIRLLSHWLYAHRDELTVVPRVPDRSPEEMAETVLTRGADRVKVAS